MTCCLVDRLGRRVARLVRIAHLFHRGWKVSGGDVGVRARKERRRKQPLIRPTHRTKDVGMRGRQECRRTRIEAGPRRHADPVGSPGAPPTAAWRERHVRTRDFKIAASRSLRTRVHDGVYYDPWLGQHRFNTWGGRLLSGRHAALGELGAPVGARAPGRDGRGRAPAAVFFRRAESRAHASRPRTRNMHIW